MRTVKRKTIVNFPLPSFSSQSEIKKSAIYKNTVTYYGNMLTFSVHLISQIKYDLNNLFKQFNVIYQIQIALKYMSDKKTYVFLITQ